MTITTKYNVGDTVWYDYGTNDFHSAVVRKISFVASDSSSTGETHYTLDGWNTPIEEGRLFPTLADCWNDLARQHEELARTYRANAEKATNVEQV